MPLSAHPPRFAKAVALERKRWIDEEPAARRVPEIKRLQEPVRPKTVREIAERWRAPQLSLGQEMPDPVHAVADQPNPRHLYDRQK